jgi:hypothetical protein
MMSVPATVPAVDDRIQRPCGEHCEPRKTFLPGMPSLILLQILSVCSGDSAEDDYVVLFQFAAASRISGHILLLVNGAEFPSGFLQKIVGIRKLAFFLRFWSLGRCVVDTR